MSVQDDIQRLITENRIVLFMKGTRMFPQCGFSAKVVELLKQEGATFKDVNVLADGALRQGIKDFAQWPTIPQLYVDGKFVGGCDIVTEMAGSGELKALLGGSGAQAS